MALPKVGSIGEYIREQRTHAKISLRQLATAAGVSNPYLSQIERGLRKPSAEILNQIAKGLHISSQALYVQAGLIEEREPEESDVLAAIRADHLITERQRQVLVDIYESFRKENQAAAAEEEARLAAETVTPPAPRDDAPSSPDDETPLPGEYLTALKPYAADPGDDHITKEIKEG